MSAAVPCIEQGFALPKPRRSKASCQDFGTPGAGKGLGTLGNAVFYAHQPHTRRMASSASKPKPNSRGTSAVLSGVYDRRIITAITRAFKSSTRNFLENKINNASCAKRLLIWATCRCAIVETGATATHNRSKLSAHSNSAQVKRRGAQPVKPIQAKPRQIECIPYANFRLQYFARILKILQPTLGILRP